MLTARQLLDWERYSQIEPFGEERDDYRAASIASTIANVNRGAGQRAYSLSDFLLKFNSPMHTHTQTVEEKIAIIKAIAASYSAGDKSH